ncbi:type I-C CRISPR-associated protein Cas8c/Csd1 [Actinoplanes sp. NPDC020271]|uniref:type I-C CRISPR-associated protein Cas8c/Csd1 n=1 Tax=Actinoplanes sp. NPDC020271 TaxID=3363896 RepID=UPI00378EE8FD
MLLQRLVEYADATTSGGNVPPFYQRKPVRWLLDIAADGTLLTLPTDLADADNKYGPRRPVPAITRTVGVAPALAVDNAEYVLGWTFEGSNPDRVPKQAAAFRELVEQWAAADPAGPGTAIAAFYRTGHHLTISHDDFPNWGRADLVGFRINQVWAHSSPSAIDYWAKVASDRKGSGDAGLCLVCQRIQPLLKTIPQQIPRRLLPGARQSASLVSVNEAVHGYELQKFLGHTPICADCALKFMGTLERLLDDKLHSMTLPGQNARLVWWVTGGSTFDPMGPLDQPDPAHIRDLLATPVDATQPAAQDLSLYCSATVGGNVARVVVRDWIEMPVAQVKVNLRQWFTDHEIVDAWTGETTHVSLAQLARATGRWKNNRRGAGEWASFGSSGEDRPAGVFHALLRAALSGRPLPPGLLAHLLHRIRTDGRIDPARAALIRLALRRPPHRREALMPTINLDMPDAAYHCGRAFAILDQLQRDVSTVANQKLNTSFAQRYLGRAIINPRAVLVSGEKTSQAWLRRLGGPLKRPGWAAAYQQRLDDVYSMIAEHGGFPNQALLAQQGNFVLGYHQQRAAMRAERNAAAEAKKNTNTQPAGIDDPQGDLA